MKLNKLEGLSKDVIDAEWFNNTESLFRILAEGKAGTTAEQNGALNVWTDDEGKFRAERMVFLSRQDNIITESKQELEVWVNISLMAIA